MNSHPESFLAVLAFGKLSHLELIRLMETGEFNFKIKKIQENTALLECETAAAKRLTNRSGGIYKMAKVCGQSLDDLVNCLPLPTAPKFSWTVSGYDTTLDEVDETKLFVGEFLKSQSLRKSNYVSPSIELRRNLQDEKEIKVNELKLQELIDSVLLEDGKRPAGFDIIVFGDPETRHISYGYTIGFSDMKGFEKRDLKRPYHDPSTTISPRMARVLVNLSVTKTRATVLDPFCGLGTILQEALICGHSVVGIDISEPNIQKTRTNIAWLRKEFHIDPASTDTIFRSNTSFIVPNKLPRVDSIATEPILLKKFEENPTFSEAEVSIKKARLDYESSLRALSRVLTKGSKIAITAPEIIDAQGKSHDVKIENFGHLNFKLYQPQTREFHIENPVTVFSSKRKIVRRKIYVMATA